MSREIVSFIDHPRLEVQKSPWKGARTALLFSFFSFFLENGNVETLSLLPGFRTRLARRPTRRRATKAGVALISSPSVCRRVNQWR